MHNLLTSIILCFVAHTASAQCVNGATATPVSATARPGVELISTAAAGTREAPMRRTAASERAKPQSDDGDERRRPTGAMLLAAVALMSGIALRRASAAGQ